MTNQNNRTGADRASSNDPAPEKQKTGGSMGAGKSGDENLGSEKPSVRDNLGSNKPGHGNNDKSND